MNDIRRAIEDLENLSTAKSVCSNMFGEMHGENLKLAVDALKRQIPEKPVIQSRFLGFDLEGKSVRAIDYFCVRCRKIIEPGYFFCPYCGQSINWEKGEKNASQTKKPDEI